MSIENQPHDWFFKMVFGQVNNTEQFIEIFLPELHKYLVPGSLRPYNTEKLSRKYEKYHLDLAFDCKMKIENNDMDVQIYILFEHKSYPDKHTPSQILFYKAVMAEEDEKLSRPYRPVIPIVFYHGEQSWNIKVDIPDFLSTELYISKYLHTLSYILFDVSKIDDTFLINNLYSNACLLSSVYAMKNIFRDLNHLRPILEKLIIEDIRECLYIIIDYTVLVKRDIEAVESILIEIGGQERMQTLTEKWKQEGLQQGIQQGVLLEAQLSVIDILETRFKNVSDFIKEKISSIDELDRVKHIRRKALEVGSIEEFLSLL